MLLGRKVIIGAAAAGVSLLTAGGVVVLLDHESTVDTTTNAEAVTDGPTTAPRDVAMWTAASPSGVPPTTAPVTSTSSAVPTSSTRAATTSARRVQPAARDIKTHRASPRSTRRTTSTTARTKHTTSSARPSGTATTASSGSASYEAALLGLVNAERTSRGLSALKAASCPDGYAESWAKHLASTGYFEHQSLSPILRTCGATRAAENIARGGMSAAAMVKLWMGSSGHRANILDPRLTQVGTAAVRGSSGAWTAVQVFIRP